MSDLDHAFWTWLAEEAPAIRSAFAAAAAARDYPALEQLLVPIAERLQAIDSRLGARLSGGAGGDITLAIQSPVPEAAPIARRVLAAAPAIAGWAFGETVESVPKNVIVRDASGAELVVAYADVRFRLLPPKPDGSISVIFVVADEFDPKNPDDQRGRMYQHAATEILKATFGGTPPGMGSYALLPASWLDSETRPVGELAAAWAATQRG